MVWPMDLKDLVPLASETNFTYVSLGKARGACPVVINSEA